ncbi:uncharacterized protein K460DRAFT_420514 [Cucurbitaria berberidis CBS 394.84]|uniref:Uncharacterized protein n=1 Tax=Cucurbitaria berberidis CBS 394.84 TaxID=1168544 RepID=A0A9P4GCE4_9PLEO|nr:uncharacterized protein K460DRAFT_420514 [Cucurbitaria berberidis CBS 394.84]KAF1842635.1 hypothetical protein K460DRAFT_420514 [Cucurbitaria berberidis CBS 394.84]
MIAGYCPICEIQMSLKFLGAIADALQEAGGPWNRNRPTKNKYPVLRQGWHLGRLQLQGVIDLLEVSVKYEARWDAEHRDKVAAARRTNSSTKALQVAEMEHRYPALISKTVARGTKRKSSVPDVNFQEIMATPTNPAHMLLFATTLQKEFDELHEGVSLRPGQSQGLVGSHPGVKVISDFLENFQEQQHGHREELKEMVHYADAMIVLVNENKVLDVFLSHSDYIEDENYEDDEVDQSRWTCLGEVLANVEAG